LTHKTVNFITLLIIVRKQVFQKFFIPLFVKIFFPFLNLWSFLNEKIYKPFNIVLLWQIWLDFSKTFISLAKQSYELFVANSRNHLISLLIKSTSIPKHCKILLLLQEAHVRINFKQIMPSHSKNQLLICFVKQFG